MSTLLTTLTARGLVHDATHGLAERLATGRPITGYVGFDPTADSLHVGNLVPVMGLAWLQRFGGRPIVLIGGGTGLVGDPSGKRTERPMLDLDTVDANARALRQQLTRFLDFEGPTAAQVTNNADWLRPLSLLDFLRDTGKHFTLGYMLQKEAVRSRLETGISFTEFAYMLVQAHDFHHLFTAGDCELQMGGSDQWGNITAGIELIGRRTGRQAHGLVLPLLTTARGTKFGKTESGNVWLDPARTSPWRFWQFWRGTEDADVGRFLRFFTFLPLPEIDALLETHAADPGAGLAQRRLAAEVTAMVHGPEAVTRVEAASRVLFGREPIEALDGETLAMIAEEVPRTPVAGDSLEGMPVIDALVAAGLAASKSDARRGIAGHGYSVNGVTVAQPDQVLSAGDLRGGRWVLLRKGKKQWGMLEVG